MREKNVPLYNKYDANKIMLCGICRIKWKEEKTHTARYKQMIERDEENSNGNIV